MQDVVYTESDDKNTTALTQDNPFAAESYLDVLQDAARTSSQNRDDAGEPTVEALDVS